MTEMKRIIDLGWANGWGETPKEITDAEAKGFKVEEISHNSRSCVTAYKIETDAFIYTWKVDSSN